MYLVDQLVLLTHKMMWGALFVVLALPFLAMSLLTSPNETDSAFELKEVFQALNHNHNTKWPPHRNNTVLKPGLHSKRCNSISPADAWQKFLSGEYKEFINDKSILVSTACLGPDSLGNNLGSYFETLLCAHRVGMHYMSVAKIWEPRKNDVGSPFLDRIPTMLLHKNPVDNKAAAQRIPQYCKCPAGCHERSRALWPRGRSLINPILRNALAYHVNITYGEHGNQTVVTHTDLSNKPTGTSLPLIPDAAIHYRCGDNFVGHYGFLPFKAFQKYIPGNAQTIFVFAENRNRKTAAKSHRAAKCDAIFNSLFKYLTSTFSQSTVVIRRGGDLYLDMARLAAAKTTICSVSTFCLWPAMINPGKAYFPLTKLVVGGDISTDLGFRWITQPAVVPGAKFEHVAVDQLLKKLNS